MEKRFADPALGDCPLVVKSGFQAADVAVRPARFGSLDRMLRRERSRQIERGAETGVPPLIEGVGFAQSFGQDAIQIAKSEDLIAQSKALLRRISSPTATPGQDSAGPISPRSRATASQDRHR